MSVVTAEWVGDQTRLIGEALPSAHDVSFLFDKFFERKLWSGSYCNVKCDLAEFH